MQNAQHPHPNMPMKHMATMKPALLVPSPPVLHSRSYDGGTSVTALLENSATMLRALAIA